MAYAVEVRELAWQPVASRRLSVSPAELEAVLGEVLLEVWAAISAQLIVSSQASTVRNCRLVALSAMASTPTSAIADRAWIMAAMNDSRMPRRTVRSLASA